MAGTMTPMPKVTMGQNVSGVTAADQKKAAECQSTCCKQHGGAGNTSPDSCCKPGC